MADGPPVTVLVLADYGGPYRGSFIAAVQALGREAGERGWSLQCGFTPVARERPWLSALAADGIAFDFAPEGGRPALRSWLERKLDAIEGDIVVHTHFTSFDLPAAAATRERPGTSVIWHVHSFLPRRPALMAKAAVKFGRIGRGVAWIVCAGEGPARAVRRRGAPAGRVVVLMNGIETDRFRPIEPAERARARAELELPEDAPVLLHFGWDWEVKGGPLFAETLVRLRELGVGATGLSVGGGADAGAAAQRLVLDRILLAPEPAEDVRRFYAAADALLATSRDEGNPFSILEALSCGLPVIGTDVAGHRIADEPPRALRLAPADPARLAAVTRDALELHPAEREVVAHEASEWIAANRDVSRWAREMVALYERALPGRSPARAT